MSTRDQFRFGVSGPAMSGLPLALPDIKSDHTCGDCKHFRRLNGSEFCVVDPPKTILLPAKTPQGDTLIAQAMYPPVVRATPCCSKFDKRLLTQANGGSHG